MRDWLTSILEVVGAGAVCAGVFTFSIGAGLIVTGLTAIGLGYLGGRQ